MSTAELKIKLIKRIAHVDNPDLVRQIQRLLDFELSNDVYKLTTEQTDSIIQAQADYSEGRIQSHEQANAEIEQWLNEK